MGTDNETLQNEAQTSKSNNKYDKRKTIITSIYKIDQVTPLKYARPGKPGNHTTTTTATCCVSRVPEPQ